MSVSTEKKLLGQCLCGAIKYAVTKLEDKMGHCHCCMCRKFHGAAFATYGEAKSESFRWLSGEKHLKSYVATNGTIRKFCDNCGSSLIFESCNADGTRVEFALGTLDSDIEQKPDVHIYTKFAASLHEVKDGLIKYTQGRDSEEVT